MIAKRFSARMLSPWRSNGPMRGASYLHLVDLDGAREGQPRNLSVVASILKTVNLSCELGGGIRNEQTIRELLDLGLCRLVIGTLAIRQPEWFRGMCRQFPRRLVLGIDARDGKVATARMASDQRHGGHGTGPAVQRRAAGGDHLYRYCHRRHAGRTERGGDGRDASGGRPAGGGFRRRDDHARTSPAWPLRAWPDASSAGPCTKEPLPCPTRLPPPGRRSNDQGQRRAAGRCTRPIRNVRSSLIHGSLIPHPGQLTTELARTTLTWQTFQSQTFATWPSADTGPRERRPSWTRSSP